MNRETTSIKIKRYALRLISTVCFVTLASHAVAQSSLSLTGNVVLDIGSNTENRSIEVTVRNHTIVVISLPLGLTILRPIISTESTTINMPIGTSQASYTISGISAGAIDYSIQLKCLGCQSDFPTQYYSPSGNKLGLADSVYLDPDDLPSTLDITAITLATVSGNLSLNQPSNRDLIFDVAIFSADQPQRVYKLAKNFSLPSGSLSTTYQVTGISRDIGGDQFGVRVQCNNCYGGSQKPIDHPDFLSPLQNHSLIDFIVSDVNLAIVPAIDLLMHDSLD